MFYHSECNFSLNAINFILWKTHSHFTASLISLCPCETPDPHVLGILGIWPNVLSTTIQEWRGIWYKNQDCSVWTSAGWRIHLLKSVNIQQLWLVACSPLFLFNNFHHDCEIMQNVQICLTDSRVVVIWFVLNNPSSHIYACETEQKAYLHRRNLLIKPLDY